MIRSGKVTNKYATKLKRAKIRELLTEYRRVVNLYIESLWTNPGKLDKATLDRVTDTSLSARYKSAALNQALDIVISTKKACKVIKKYAQLPVFTGAAKLDAKFVTIEQGEQSFDLVIKLSTLDKGKRITIPTKKTKVINKHLKKPNAHFRQACLLSEDSIILYIESDDTPLKEVGQEIGIDIGVNKLLTLSNGDKLGTDFKTLRDKINRKVKNSKAYKRALLERDNFINKVVNQIPFDDIKTLVVEDLKNLKKGKSKKRSKDFRKAVEHWTYSKVLKQIVNKTEENRIHLEFVPPAYTSQECPICHHFSSLNRNNEKFKCTSCNYESDADIVGACNILMKYIQVTSLESVTLNKVN